MTAILHRALCLVSLVVFCVSVTSGTVSANGLPREQSDLYKNQIFRFNYFDDQCNNSGSSSASGTTVASGGSWNSGLQPPYILEQFAIEVLKDLAAKLAVDQANAVTLEHVIGLLGFMIGEGGDINNRWKFNPLNTGINDPDLIDGGHMIDGRQSFKSFDAGVEGTARTMVLPTQNRLGQILTTKGSTAAQFMDTLTHYKRYDGNKAWAQASEEPNTANYYAQRLALVDQVRRGYDDLASTVLGTDKYEIVEHITDKSKLQFHIAGTASATTSVSGTASLDECSTENAPGTISGNCGGSPTLKVPQGGSGVNICYFAQCTLGFTGSYDWCECGCEPTSVLMIRATMEGDPNLKKDAVLGEIKKAGGVSGSCPGSFPSQWLAGYLKPKGYTVQAVHDRSSGALTDADLAKAKQLISQGHLLLAHTSVSIDSAGTKGTAGHYLVVHAVDAQGNFYVANPGAKADNNKAVSPAKIKAWLDEFYAVKKG